MPMHHRTFRTTFFASLPLLTLLLTGCATTSTTGNGLVPAFVAGNWQFSSSAPVAAHLAAVSGELSGNASAITGTFHTQSSSSCVAPTKPFAVSGSADAKGAVKLTGTVAGGTVTITGTLAADGKSLSDAAYGIVGGACALPADVPAVATSFTPVNGTYNGSFINQNSQPVLDNVVATLSQSPASDTSGNYTLSGNVTLPQNACFTSGQPLPVTNTQVTGGTFTLTFTDGTSTSSVTATGTFSQDATKLQIATWTLNGPCGPETGQGTLTQP